MSFEMFSFEAKGDLGVKVESFRGAAAKGVRLGMEEAAQRHIKKIQNRFVKFAKGSGLSRSRLRWRTRGAKGLRESFEYKVTGRWLNTLRLDMWSDSPYAATHEFGGTIQARGGDKNWLRVPTNRVLTQNTGKVQSKYEDASNAFFVKFSSTHAAIFERRVRSKPVPLFWLHKSVKIPARLKFAEIWNNDFVGHTKAIERRMNRAIEAAAK